MQLQTVWESLPYTPNQSGWQALAIQPTSCISIKAGLRSPDRTEGLLVDVPSDAIPAGLEYPDASGFEVRAEKLPQTATTRLSLSRTPGSSLELFAILAEDVAGSVADAHTPAVAVTILLARIRAWQMFMKQQDAGRMSDQAETGLVGELLTLETLFGRIDAGAAVTAWRGPIGGLHDFKLHEAALEVKSTAALRPTLRIMSLDQLDADALASLFLIVVQLNASRGNTLPEIAARARNHVMEQAATYLPDLDVRLLSAGFIAAQTKLFRRRFTLEGIKAYKVATGFPSMTRGTVPAGIQEASYSLSLSSIEHFEVPTDTAITAFIGTNNGTE